MIPSLIIIVAIPIILGVSIVSPFDPGEIQDEQIQEPPEDETSEPTRDIFYILLGIIWLFFLFRLLRIMLTGKYRSSVKKQ